MMTLATRLLLAPCLFFVVLLSSAAAFAQDATTTLDFSPILNHLVEIVAGILMVLGTWAIHRLSAFLKLKEDSEVRAYLETSLDNAIAYAKAAARERGGDWLQVDVKRSMVAEAANYVIRATPDALKRFGITPDQLQDMLRARLEQADQWEAIP